MEKCSVLLKRIMLGILLGLLALALCLAAWTGLTSHSYLAALILGAVWAALLVLLLRRRALPVPELAGLWVTLFCFVLNLVWVLLIRIEPFSDYETFWHVACALANGTEIESAWYIAMYPHILGTATFLSVFVRLFGESVLAVSVVNVALTSLSCGLVWLLGKELFSREVGFLAALLWAVCPCKLMLNSLVFSEPLYTCLILLFLWLFLLLSRRMKLGADGEKPVGAVVGIGALGLLLAAINIVRPIAAILLIAAAIWLVFLRGDEEKSGRLWCFWLAAFLAMTALFRVSGALWDRHVENTLGMAPSGVPVYNIYVGFNEDTQGQWSAEDMDLLFSYLSEEGVTTSEAQSRMWPHLRERLASGIDFKRLFASKLLAFLGNDELGGYTYRFTRPETFCKICMAVCNVFYYGVVLAAMAGLLRMLRSRALGAGQLLPLYVLGLTLAHMLVEVSNRYHYSIIPILIIFAAAGLCGGERRNA